MKKVIIVGASSGMGRQLAILYLNAGHQVGITGRRLALLEELKGQFPGQVQTAAFDVTGDENIHHLESLIEKMGGVDLFIYNSGFGDAGKELDWQVEKTTLLTNVMGFMETTNWMFNFFKKQGHGHIAGISSIASYRGNSWAPAYSASKAFISNYLEGISMKAFKMKINITVTDIQPGFVKTKMAKGYGQFWVAPVEKAALQIYAAINRKKRRAYITRRWRIIAWLMKWFPYGIYKRIG
jgi:short-subunit dehydrogenase